MLLAANNVLKQQIKSSVLSNGIQVTTIDAPGSLYGIGLIVRTYSPSLSSSLSHYKQAKLASAHFQHLVDQDTSISGICQVQAKREYTLYGAVGQAEHLPKLVNLMSQTFHHVNKQEYEDEELDIDSMLRYELQEAQNKPLELIPELMHGAAFGDCRLAANVYSLLQITNQNLPSTPKIVPKDLIILGAGHGIEHHSFANLIETLFGFMKPELRESSDTSILDSFSPRILRVSNPNEQFVHLGVALESFPVSNSQSLAVSVLSALLGGGGSFSSGGPGKGMYSRLYTQVLNRHAWIDSSKQAHSAYSTTGFFGLHGSCFPDRIRDLCSVLFSQLQLIAESSIPISELIRARNHLKSNLLGSTECRPTQLEDFADQVYYRPLDTLLIPSEICSKIDQIGLIDLKTVAENLIENGRKNGVGVVVYGGSDKSTNNSATITLDQVSEIFNKTFA